MEFIALINFIGLIVAFVLTAITMSLYWWVVHKIDERILSTVITEEVNEAKLEMDSKYKLRNKFIDKRTGIKKYAETFLTITIVYWFIYIIWMSNSV